MARSTLLAAGVLTAALTAGGAAGLILGTPLVSGAQEGSTTTTQDDGTTTVPDDEGEARKGCADGEAPADEAPATEGSSTASA